MKSVFLLVLSAMLFAGCTTAKTIVTNDVPNFAVVSPGVWRGGQPVSTNGWNYLKSIGVSNVVKLNLESEGSDDGARAAGMKVNYFPIPFRQQMFCGPSFQTLSNAVSRITPGTYIHCTHGQDRTGEVIGCKRRWQDGWTKKDAYAEMKAHGFHWELLGLKHAWNDRVK